MTEYSTKYNTLFLFSFFNNKLYCVNRSVDMENRNQLAQLHGPECVFTARDTINNSDLGYNKTQCREALLAHGEKKVKRKASNNTTTTTTTHISNVL